MKIPINQDIEDADFKENFFYHFTKRQTAFLAAAAGCGIGIYIVCFLSGVSRQATVLLMALVVVPVMLVGFYTSQGFSFIDYTRKYILLRLCRHMAWESTEDLSGHVLKVRGRRTTNEITENARQRKENGKKG